MASKRRIRRKTCSGKVQYTTQKLACDAISALRRKGIITDWVVPYHCPFCKQYHFGHPPKHVRSAIVLDGRG